MNKHAVILFVPLFLLLVGCAATGPQFTALPTPQPDKGTVVIYRLNQIINRGGWPRIRIDNERMDTLKVGGYVVYQLEPGTREIRFPASLLWPWSRRWNIEIAAGETQYYRGYFDFRGLTRIGDSVVVDSKLNVESVGEQAAKAELGSLRLVSD